MSHLGTLLDLDDGSRLTDVALYPLGEDHTHHAHWAEGGAQGTVYFHVLTPQTTHDPASLASAAAAFLPSRLATISGYRPDGRTWIATAQLSPHDIEELNAGPAADAGLRRALGLTGMMAARVKGLALPARILTAAYEGEGDVEEWSVPELFIGLLVERNPGRFTDVEFATAGWVDWYNNRCLRGSLGMLTPIEFETFHYEALTREPEPAK